MKTGTIALVIVIVIAVVVIAFLLLRSSSSGAFQGSGATERPTGAGPWDFAGILAENFAEGFTAVSGAFRDGDESVPSGTYQRGTGASKKPGGGYYRDPLFGTGL